MFAIALVVFLAGGSFLDIFPLRGLVSSNWENLNWFEKILDYLWHITLPVLSLVIAGFATLTMLTKNSFIDEINKLYVSTAKAKGLSEKKVLYGHVFRNAMLIVIAGFPAAFISILFTGSLLIEVIFSMQQPSMQSTTTNAPSVTRSAAVTSELKSTCPGESIKLIK